MTYRLHESHDVRIRQTVQLLTRREGREDFHEVRLLPQLLEGLEDLTPHAGARRVLYHRVLVPLLRYRDDELRHALLLPDAADVAAALVQRAHAPVEPRCLVTNLANNNNTYCY